MREIQELERSNGRRILAGLVAAAGLAVIVGLLLAPKGKGEPELEQHILVIDDQSRGAAYYLDPLGFEALSGPLEAWQDEVAAEQKLGAEQVGLVELLDFADVHGYGYIAIENPWRFSDEIAGLELAEGAPTIADDTAFAVLSVGEFASPHVLSVTPPPGTVELGPGPQLLQALFAQPRLQAALEEKPALQEVQHLRLSLDRGIDALDRISKLEGEAAALMTEARADLEATTPTDENAKVVPLLEPLAGATPLPLADGRVLLHRRALVPYSDDGNLTLHRAPQGSLEMLGADLPADAGVHLNCGTGYESALVRMHQVRVSAERDAVFILDGDNLGVLAVLDAKAGPCGLRRVLEQTFPGREDDYFVAHRSGLASRDVDNEVLVITVDTVNGDEHRIEVPGIASSSSLVWLDERRLVALVRLSESAV
ncbi:MAG: hypothetical protein KC457_31790, partial [Myxococcales bacterium]|nr:hypothetical protein [Myxococcales bacterium]